MNKCVKLCYRADLQCHKQTEKEGYEKNNHATFISIYIFLHDRVTDRPYKLCTGCSFKKGSSTK